MVVVIGNFDGVHLGHLKVLQKACEIAREKGEKTLVFTFENHPRSFFGSDIKYLISNNERESLIKAAGIDEVVFWQFDRNFADLTAAEFISFLKEKYDCTSLVCGEGFHFGKDATGRIEDVSGLDVCVVPLFVVAGETVSSTRIRNLLIQGDVKTASMLLGRFFSIKSKVEYGKQLGTKLGFPTINQTVPENFILPKNGVYATIGDIGGLKCRGVTNIGIRPTIAEKGEKQISIETHLLIEKNENLYGMDIEIFFIDFIRDEKKFNSIEELKKQILTDCQYSKDVNL